MGNYLKRNGLLIAVIALVCVVCACFALFTVSGNSADAAASFDEADSLTIGHITDTHYYALRLCYTDGDPIETDDLDYFYNWVMDKSTKMWLESAVSLDSSMKTFEKQMPDYVVVSGDCAQDGELMGHIDLANKLRKLQNKVRETKPDFQVFVTMGNHDIYNPETYRFDIDGMRKTFYYTTRIEVAHIYAGLGYPNLTDEEAEVFYGPLKEMDGGKLLPSEYSYVRSNLSSAFKYAWEFVKKDGTETRIFEFDGATDPKHDEVTMPKLLEEELVELIDNTPFFRSSLGDDGHSLGYLYDNTGYGMDLEKGTLTGLFARKDGKFAYANIDCIISNADEGHVLGGQIQDYTQQWLNDNYSLSHPTKDVTIAAAMHHSAIEHWNMEEEVTTGFIVYNPAETTDFLADYGVRYIYTGHQHANDKASYISAKGNQIIDIEGSANVSVGSQVKITTIKRGTYSGLYAEQAYINAFPNKECDATELYDKVLKNDKYGYVARNKVKDYIDTNKKTITDYSKYARIRIYENVVDNTIDRFLKKEITQKLQGMLDGLFANMTNAMFKGLAKHTVDIVKLADNLIAEINDKVLKDYTYGGEKERFKADDMKVFAFLEEMVQRVLAIDVSGEGDNVFDLVIDCYMRHSTGEDWNSFEEMIKEKPSYAKAFENMKSGKFVTDLLNVLLDEQNGLMFLIKGLCNTTFDLTKGLDEDFISVVETLLTTLGVNKKDSENPVTLKSFNLGVLAKALGDVKLVTDMLDGLGVEIDLKNLSIPEIINDIVAKYCTDNFKQGLGEYAYIVVSSFGIDGGHKDVLGADNQLMKIAEYADEEVTYIAKARKEVVTIANGKLPSMLTSNFGKDVATTRNFTYFTDRRVTDGAIQFTEDVEKHSGATTINATTTIFGTTKPLIDLGIWCQSGYVELSRHTISLTGLKPDTTYAYRAGSPKKNYWSEWYTFTTAPANGSFEAFVFTDVQSSTQSAYERISAIQNDIVNKYFQNGVSFMINPGDLVDNGRNLSQYRWLYDADQSFNASYPSVVTAGNHDNKYFSLAKASNVESYGGVSANAYVDDYNYLWSHYNYDIPESQIGLGGFYYSFDYGKVHFAVINTNDIVTTKNSVKQLGDKQYEWLVADLTESEADYKVVIMHKSLYSEGSHSYDADVVGMRAQLTPLFAETGVNLVLSGHDHVYNETYYIDGEGKKVQTDANGKNEIGKEGTLYVTMGCLGEKFYNFVDNPDIDTATGTYLHKDGKLAEPTYGKLVYDGETLCYYGYQYLREFDEKGNLVGGTSVEITKGSGELFGIIVLATIVAVVVLTVVVTIIACVVSKKKKA